jgi:hypothetical protein
MACVRPGQPGCQQQTGTSPSAPVQPSPTRTPNPTFTPTKTPTISVTPSTSGAPGASITPSVTPSSTPSISRTPSVTPSTTPSTTPSISITPSISKSPTPTPTPSPSADCTPLNVFSQMQQAALQYMRTDVAYYKHNLYQTKRNIYGESLEKWYYEPFLIRCMIDREPDSIRDEMFGPDVNKTATLTIPRIAWEQGNAGLIQGANVLPEIGDIIYDRSTERYYEVNNINHTYIPIPSNINVGQSSCPQAELVTFSLSCHQTRVSRLNLSPYKVL